MADEMRWLSAVTRKELRQHLASFRFLISTALTLVLAALATLAGTADYDLRRERFRTRSEQHRLALSEIHVYSYLQPVAVRPPEPLSILERGFEGRLGDEVRISLFEIPAAASGEHRGNPYMASFQGFDLTTIVRVVLGLQALLLTFDAFIGERERRTLELILAHGVSRTTLFAGKYLGAFAALLTTLSASLLASLAVVLLRGSTELALPPQPRVIALFATYAGYLSLMILVGLLLSLSAKSAAQSLAYSILAWLLLVFLIPPAAIAAAREIRGAGHDPQRTQDAVARLEQERGRQLAEARAEDPLRTELNAHRAPFFQTDGRAALHRYGSRRYYDSLAAYHGYETALGMRYAERIFELRQRGDRELRSAERLADVLASLSPAFLLERLAESFAATSIADHDDFLAACRDYRRTLVTYLEGRQAFGSWRWFTDDPPATRPWTTLLGVAPEEVDAGDIGELAGRFRSPEIQRRLADEQEAFRTDPARLLDLADLPLFLWEGPALERVVRRTAPEIALFFGLQALLAGVISVRLSRYEVLAAAPSSNGVSHEA